MQAPAFDCWCCVTTRPASEASAVPGMCESCRADVGTAAAWEAHRLAVLEGDAPQTCPECGGECRAKGPDADGFLRCALCTVLATKACCAECFRHVPTPERDPYSGRPLCRDCGPALRTLHAQHP